MLRTVRLISMCCFVLILVSLATAAGPLKVFTDPAKAGPDFTVQGEYEGTTDEGDGVEKWGVQVIALGGGKFSATVYHGGLPGKGGNPKEKFHAQGETRDGATILVCEDEGSGTVQDGKILVKNPKGKTIGTLEKVCRKSPTLGTKPPAGAVVLFDGSTPDHFRGGRMTDDKLLMEGVTSKQTFGSHKLHLEFRTPFKPHARGQGRGNSGFYAQGRYEVQILDSFGLEGKQNECGGIYSIAEPSVNMCLPPLSWQTYDVDFTAAEFKDGKKVKNARMTVLHNGVEIHKDVELTHSTTASPVKEGLEQGPIFLQNHGNPVRFRNIWVVEK